MIRLRILHNLRTAVMILVAAGVSAGVGVLVWANHTGLPTEWRRALEEEIGKHANGTRVRIGGLSYIPMQGFIAHDVELFDTHFPDTRTAYIHRVDLDLDFSKLIRGQARLLRLELSDAMISLPTNPGAPELVIEHASGRVLMNSGRTIEIRDASGLVEGIRIDFGARLLGHGPGVGSEQDDRARIAARRLLIARIAGELQHWSINPDSPPLIRVNIEGELDEPQAMRIDLSVVARDLEKSGYSLRSLEFSGELVAGVLSLHQLRASDGFGRLEARLDYDLTRRCGKFSGISDLDIPRLLQAYFDISPSSDFSFSSPPEIEGSGSFSLPKDAAPAWSIAGTASSGPLTFRGNEFDSLVTRFSATPDAFYLREAEVRIGDSTARGKFLTRDRLVRYQLSTDIPLRHWRPFFADTGLLPTLDLIEQLPGSSLSAHLEGTVDLDNPLNWSCSGGFEIHEASYRGIQFHHFSTQISLDPLDYQFENVHAIFNDQSYPLRRGKPSRPTLKLARLMIDPRNKHAEAEGLEGRAWPGQVARLFNPDLAARLEQYRFHSAPEVTARGVIDFSGENAPDTDFHSWARTSGITEYEFLGHSVPMSDARAHVRVRPGRTDVEDFQCGAFDGRIAGRLTFTQRGSSSSTSSEFQWTRLSLPEIARIYQFEQEAGGLLTGRAEFAGTSGTIRDLTGHGTLALEDGELFAVPIFGPLSPLISGVLSNRNAGFETARDAFCTYTIKNGTLVTSDFHTQTTSIDFTGEGKVELADKTIDMIMRLDARGLLGVITLPLRPFYGLFQFRGTGTLNKPEWRSVLFTAPSDGFDPDAPPKARVVSEPPRAVPVNPRQRTAPPDRRPGRHALGRP